MSFKSVTLMKFFDVTSHKNLICKLKPIIFIFLLSLKILN